MSEPIDHPELCQLLGYWTAKRRGRPMPSRADIDPTELPAPLWEHLMLMDVVREAEGDEPGFRYRLVGSAVEREIGRPVTGASGSAVTQAWGRYGAYVRELYTEVATSGRPSYVENVFIPSGRRLPTLTRRLLLPLSSDGATADMVLSGHYFERPPRRLGIPPDVDSYREIVRRQL